MTWAPEPGAITGRFSGLGAALRAHGVHVGPSDVTDAARVAVTLGFDDRDRLRTGLAAAMIRRTEDRATFDQLFDIYFPAGVGARTRGPAAEGTDLLDQLADALAADDAVALERLAATSVELHGRVDPADPQRGWSAARALDVLAPQRAVTTALERARAGGTPAGEGPPGADTAWAINPWDRAPRRPERLSDRFDRTEVRRRVDRFRDAVVAETRRRNTELGDRERLARLSVPPPLRRRDFVSSGERTLAELEREIAPLARKLAARLDARERAGRGGIDLRRTLRASMSTGGVPIDPVYHRRSRHRPDLVLLADLSGSVGGFSTFTMLLMQALRQHFRRLRAFGFVSSTAEITDLVRTLPPGTSLTSWALRTPELIARGAGSNYGWALRTFARGHLDAITARSTVLILGDGRTNFADPNVSDLQRIRDRARHVAWLNPEPSVLWHQGDSEVRRYQQVVPMHECRNLEQLRHFVAELLPA